MTTRRKIRNLFTLIPVTIGLFLLGLESAKAQGFIPTWLQGIVEQLDTPDRASAYVNDRLRLALTVLFVIVIIVAFIYSALAGIKLITSQGESGKMTEGKEAVKAILFGFGAMILAVAGIFVVFFLLGGAPGSIDVNNGINLDPDG